VVAALALRWAVGERLDSRPTFATIVGIAIGLAGWLPVWHGSAQPAAPDVVQPAYLFLSRWGYGASPAQGMPVQLGVVAVGGGLIALVVGQAPLRLRAALAGMVVAPAVLALSGPVWGPLVPFLGQPWQALGLAALGLALATALVPLPERRAATSSAIALALVALVSSFGFLQPTVLAALPRGEPVLATFGDRIALLAIQRGGGAPPAFLVDWQALADGAEDYRVQLEVTSPDGRPVAQRDFVPLDGVRPTAGWAKGEVIRDRLALPNGLPPGVYRVALSLIGEGSGEPLPVRLPDGSRVDRLVLGEVAVP
jgi:hypothetical protein